ncbi:hypothetical protein [Amycolatopsis jejuensis]|uniref:hypothetical protein n=1 Tax=Amycolatopsis jejuensis TaxID=330084 RepID=UPI000B157CC7|nr:hypothetical protein [Amycolatopsis jejuensis]
MSYSQPYPAYPPAVNQPAGRAVPRVLSGLCGLVLTPVALGLMGFGGFRQQQVLTTFSTRSDALGIALLVAGAVLLLGVAALGAWSSAGPVTGGLVWCVLPALVALAMPRWGLEILNVLPRGNMNYGLATWLFSGALLGVGFLLVGTGLAATLARRRR